MHSRLVRADSIIELENGGNVEDLEVVTGLPSDITERVRCSTQLSQSISLNTPQIRNLVVLSKNRKHQVR